jgi:hypothetical protein
MNHCTPDALLHDHLSGTSTWVLGVQQALRRLPRTSIDSERFERYRNVWMTFTIRPTPGVAQAQASLIYKDHI